jgi:hypothetical protein
VVCKQRGTPVVKNLLHWHDRTADARLLAYKRTVLITGVHYDNGAVARLHCPTEPAQCKRHIERADFEPVTVSAVLIKIKFSYHFFYQFYFSAEYSAL